MKAKRIIPAILVTFIFVFIFEWVLHGILLKGMYEATPQLWRPQAVMPQYMPFLGLGQFLFTVFLGLLFVKGYEGRGIGEGLRFGLLVGLLLAPINLVWYAIQPLAPTLIAYWIIGSIIEMLIAGAILAAICRPKSAMT